MADEQNSCYTNNTACNRVPFLSDSSCFRGNVNIHKFDSFPYCSSYSYTDADVPPEIVPTQYIPIPPPPCSCININYDVDLKWNKSNFKGIAQFDKNGDCCEGDYNTNFKLEIPCPVRKASSIVRMSIGYGLGRSTVEENIITVDPDKCEINTKTTQFDLTIPCPVSETNKNVNMKVSYGGGGVVSKPVVDFNPDGCTINPIDASFDLTIPCPVSDDNQDVTMRVSYGSGEVVKGRVVDVDKTGCTLKPVKADFDLTVPCPQFDNTTLSYNISFFKRCNIIILETYSPVCVTVSSATRFFYQDDKYNKKYAYDIRSVGEADPDDPSKINFTLLETAANHTITRWTRLYAGVTDCAKRRFPYCLFFYVEYFLSNPYAEPEVKAGEGFGFESIDFSSETYFTLYAYNDFMSKRTGEFSLITEPTGNGCFGITKTALDIDIPCPAQALNTDRKLKIKISYADSFDMESSSSGPCYLPLPSMQCFNLLEKDIDNCGIACTSQPWDIKIPPPILFKFEAASDTNIVFDYPSSVECLFDRFNKYVHIVPIHIYYR